MNFIWFLLFGALAGYLASLLVRGRGLGLLGDIVVGIIGAFIGGYALGWLGITTYGFVGDLIAAVLGAVILLALIKLIKRAAE